MSSVCSASLLSAARRQTGLDPFFGGPALLIGDIEKTAKTAHQILLQVVNLAIGIDHFPKHFDQFDPGIMIEGVLHGGGILIKLDGIIGMGFRLIEEAIGRLFVNPKPPDKQIGDLAALIGIEIMIHPGRFHQQGSNRQTLFVLIGNLRLFWRTGKQPFQPIEHCSTFIIAASTIPTITALGSGRISKMISSK
mgnify:CR=1 FL=1